MWIVPFVVFFCSLVSCGQGQGPGQDRAWFRRSNDGAGLCQYTFTVNSPTESSCPNVAVKTESENLSARITLLETVVSRVLGAETGSKTGGETGSEAVEKQEIRQLLQDKKELKLQVEKLQMRVKELTSETEKLRSKPCPMMHTESTDSFGDISGSGSPINGAFQEMKAELSEIPAPAAVQQSIKNNAVKGCGELISIGEPMTHQKAEGITGKYGVWFQDPEPSEGGPYGPDTVWRINAVGKDVKELYAYENLEQLGRGRPVKVMLLPEPAESTGATVYRNSLYYQRKRSPTLLRYDLNSETITARRDLLDAGFHGRYPYSWGGYTDIDLAVDEEGLWVIYSTEKARGALVVSRLDPENLEVTRSWETKARKNGVANAFMACGRLYTVASYSSNTTTVNYVFDTASEKSEAVKVPFRNKYGYNSMIDYNPAKKKLYAWDNFHMVTYDVNFGSDT